MSIKKKVDLCISDDDTTDIYKDVMESDVIIMASPIHFYSVTAQMKSLYLATENATKKWSQRQRNWY